MRKKKKGSTPEKPAGGSKSTGKSTPKQGVPKAGLMLSPTQAKRPRIEKGEAARSGHDMMKEFMESRGSNTKPAPPKGTRNESNSRTETDAAANTGNDSEDTDDEGHDDEAGFEQFEDASDLETSIEDVTPGNDEAAAKAEKALALQKNKKPSVPENL